MATAEDEVRPNPRYCHVRALNLVDDVPGLDVFLGGLMVANNISYRHKGPYVRLRAGTMSAAAFVSHTSFRFYAFGRVPLEEGAYTLIVTGNARSGRIWTVEDALQERPRTVRLVNVARGVCRASLSVIDGRPLAAAYGEATEYLLWPPRCASLALYAGYANEDLRIRVPQRLMHTMGPHTVYLSGSPSAPPEALMFRDGPEY